MEILPLKTSEGLAVRSVELDIKKVEEFKQFGFGHVAAVLRDIRDDGDQQVVQRIIHRKRVSAELRCCDAGDSTASTESDAVLPKAALQQPAYHIFAVCSPPSNESFPGRC